MSPEDQRIAIAQACGWVFKEGGVFYHSSGLLKHIPDYPNDLNAMHEAEKTLNAQQAEDFTAHLANAAQMKRTKATVNSDYFIVAHATAPQRAEAFLRTIGKWQEQPQEQSA